MDVQGVERFAKHIASKEHLHFLGQYGDLVAKMSYCSPCEQILLPSQARYHNMFAHGVGLPAKKQLVQKPMVSLSEDDDDEFNDDDAEEEEQQVRQPMLSLNNPLRGNAGSIVQPNGFQ